jgi:hypothetical protein
MLGGDGEPLDSDFDEDDMDMRDIMKSSFYYNVMNELNQLGEQGVNDADSLTLGELGQDSEYHDRRAVLEKEVREKLVSVIVKSFEIANYLKVQRFEILFIRPKLCCKLSLKIRNVSSVFEIYYFEIIYSKTIRAKNLIYALGLRF